MGPTDRFRLLIALPLLEGGVEGQVGWGEVGSPHESQRVWRAPVAVHARVLPFDGERTLVHNPVESAQKRLEVHIAVTWRYEGPAPLRRPKVDVGAEDRSAAVQQLLRVLHVNVIDAVSELGDERCR